MHMGGKLAKIERCARLTLLDNVLENTPEAEPVALLLHALFGADFTRDVPE